MKIQEQIETIRINKISTLVVEIKILQKEIDIRKNDLKNNLIVSLKNQLRETKHQLNEML